MYRGTSIAAGFALSLALSLACATDAPRRRRAEPAPEPAPAARARALAALGAALDAPEAQPGVLAPGAAVTARLAFGADADLDLYVTDPSLESVYFAKRESVSGGALVADRRCDAPAPRIEVAAYPVATPGPWRVGIDHPERCDGGDEAAPFVVELAAPDGVRRVEGTIGPGEFRMVVIETTLPAAAAREDVR